MRTEVSRWPSTRPRVTPAPSNPSSHVRSPPSPPPLSPRTDKSTIQSHTSRIFPSLNPPQLFAIDTNFTYPHPTPAGRRSSPPIQSLSPPRSLPPLTLPSELAQEPVGRRCAGRLARLRTSSLPSWTNQVPATHSSPISTRSSSTSKGRTSRAANAPTTKSGNSSFHCKSCVILGYPLTISIG
jgi:hypothetical protein